MSHNWSPGPVNHGATDPKIPSFGVRAFAKEQARELAAARAELQRLQVELGSSGVLEVAELRRIRDQYAAQITEEEARLSHLRAQITTAEEALVLQEVGLYEYRHPLADVVAYREKLQQLRWEIKQKARSDRRAVRAATSWEINGSLTEGRRMADQIATLMLRAYNTEAENLVRALKPYKLANSLQRLDKIAAAIEKSGRTMQLSIDPAYHQLRRYELELTADYLEKRERQKQAERDELERQREERRVQQELAREIAKIKQQETQARRKRQTADEKGNIADRDRLDAQLADLEFQRQQIDYRVTNTKAGFVYVVSNIGVFGPDVVHIGSTRRFDPQDRIRDLNSTSVPFNYDLHTLFFSKDAVGIEAELHRLLDDKRINRVNLRREFFRTTPARVRDLLGTLTDTPFEFTEIPEASEYRQSRTTTT